MIADVVDGGAESCEVCGFVWDAVAPADIPGRLATACAATAALLRADPGRARRWPSAEQWSMLVYAGHMRDVLYNLRDRIVVGAAEDNPTPKPMHMNLRVDLGLYEGEDPTVTATELELAGQLFGRTVAVLDDQTLARPIFYPYPRPETRTLRWVAAQALHEIEHHRDDVRAIAVRGA